MSGIWVFSHEFDHSEPFRGAMLTHTLERATNDSQTSDVENNLRTRAIRVGWVEFTLLCSYYLNYDDSLNFRLCKLFPYLLFAIFI